VAHFLTKTRGKPHNALRRVHVGFALVAVAIVSFILMSERAYFNSANVLNDLNSIGQANVAIQHTATDLGEAERQMNSYLKTRQARFKSDFEMTVQRSQETLRTFAYFTQTSPQSNSLLFRLKAVAQSQLEDMLRVVNATKNDSSAASPVVAISGIAEFRLLRAEWVASEATYISERRSEVIASLGLIRKGVIVLGIFSVLAFFYYIRQSNELEKQRKLQKNAIAFERDRLVVEVASRTSELTELNRHLQGAIEDERSRLARNLHDDLGALLTSAKLDASRIRVRLQGGAPEAMALLNHLVEMLNNGIALGRQVIENLRPSALANLGLVAALEILIGEFSKNSDVLVHRELAVPKIDPETELVAYRIVQEALTNVTRYANAKEVWLSVAIKQKALEIVVRDDGTGFDPSVIRKSAYGLLGMRFRVETQGGTLTVRSSPGKGATIKVVIPLGSSLDGTLSA
jgi:signal transduction histidine kinase